MCSKDGVSRIVARHALSNVTLDRCDAFLWLDDFLDEIEVTHVVGVKNLRFSINRSVLTKPILRASAAYSLNSDAGSASKEKWASCSATSIEQ